ncbi:MAG: NADH-quinone oxidoreductase subunit [Acidimicrobiaceae bacterium]|jgi:NADH:ubiquinone oxidoreductase subunit F (NADH-binding)
MTHERVLAGNPVTSLEQWIEQGGGQGLDAARRMGSEALVATVEAAGLRGRGGAGFPTATKWRTVLEYRTKGLSTPVVVNAAEGEPGTFKDRTILRHNPYQLVEGALIAASAVGADWLIFGLKASFEKELTGLRRAIDEIKAAGWADGVTIDVNEGPASYLYGEETALLEVIDGREPFPRVAPPWRQGVDEGAASTDVAPTLVNNVETMSNLPGIAAQGPDWFRSVGTEKSPGTIVCTVSGAVQRDAVGEIPMGTTLRDAIDIIAGGPRKEREIVAVLGGVSNAVLTAEHLDVPLTYEDLAAIGSGLGSCGFLVFDDETDFVAVAHGVSRFLAVESCGQCTPCKEDGRSIAAGLDRMRRSDAEPDDLDVVLEKLETVADGARCFLAQQHQTVVRSIIAAFHGQFRAHADGTTEPVDGFPIAEILDLQGEAVLIDERQLRKQPDWTYNEVDSGKSPSDLIDVRADGAGDAGAINETS